MRCDVTDPAAVEAAFAEVEEAHGPVEVLVANAGITADTLLLRMTEDDWSSVIDTNLTGVVPARQAGVPRGCCGCAAAGSSSSPRWSGLLGLRRPGQLRGLQGRAWSAWPARSPASYGSRGDHRERRRARVRRDRHDRRAHRGAEEPDQDAGARSGATRRTDEIASAVTWLASDGAGYVTGAVIPVDGGLGMGH